MSTVAMARNGFNEDQVQRQPGYYQSENARPRSRCPNINPRGETLSSLYAWTISCAYRQISPRLTGIRHLFPRAFVRAAPNGVSSDGMLAPSEIDASMFTELPSFFGKPTACMGEIGGEEVTK